MAKDYSYTLLDPRDLKDFAGLSTCTVSQRQRISLGVGWELVRWHLEGMYGKVEEGVDKEGYHIIRVSTQSGPFLQVSRLNRTKIGHGGCRRQTHPGTRVNARVGL